MTAAYVALYFAIGFVHLVALRLAEWFPRQEDSAGIYLLLILFWPLILISVLFGIVSLICRAAVEGLVACFR
jgi:hypothetical protein